MATLEEELFFNRMNRPKGVGSIELEQNTGASSNDGGLEKLRSDLLQISNDTGLPPTFFNVTRRVPPTRSFAETENKISDDVMSAVANSGVDMNSQRARAIMKNMEQSGENPEDLRRQLESFKNKSFMELEDGQIVQRGAPVGLGTSPARTFVENEIANNDAILNRMAQKNYTENERDFGFNVGALMDNQMANSNQTTLQALLSLLESGQISPTEAEQAFNRIKQKEREAEQAASVQAMNTFNQISNLPAKEVPQAPRGLSLSREGLSIPRRGN